MGKSKFDSVVYALLMEEIDNLKNGGGLVTKEWFINTLGIEMDNNNVAIDYKVDKFSELAALTGLVAGNVAEVATTENGQWWNIIKTTRLKGIYAYNGTEWIRPNLTQTPSYDELLNGDTIETTEKRSWSPKVLYNFIVTNAINDILESTTSLYSSSKIEELNNVTLGLLIRKAEINDEEISSGMTYSSSKLENDKTLINNEIALKVNKTTTVNNKALSSNITITKADVGLSLVQNIADADKDVYSCVKVTALDTKSVNSTPLFYIQKGIGSYLETKFNSFLELTYPSVGTLSQLETKVHWNDTTGGYPMQIATNIMGMFWRMGIDAGTWGGWNRFVTDYWNVDYVVATWRSVSEWRRVYKSGWIEQGGYVTIKSDSSTTVTLPIAMVDSYYSISLTVRMDTNVGSGGSDVCYFGNPTTTGFTLSSDYSSNSYKAGIRWEVKGFKA